MDDAVQTVALELLEFEFEPAKSNGATERTALISLIDRRLSMILRAESRYRRRIDELESQRRPEHEWENPPSLLHLDVQEAVAQLPTQEQAICEGLAQGDSLREIARRLGCSWHAVAQSVSRIRRHFQRLNLQDWLQT